MGELLILLLLLTPLLLLTQLLYLAPWPSLTLWPILLATMTWARCLPTPTSTEWLMTSPEPGSTSRSLMMELEPGRVTTASTFLTAASSMSTTMLMISPDSSLRSPTMELPQSLLLLLDMVLLDLVLLDMVLLVTALLVMVLLVMVLLVMESVMVWLDKF